MAWLDDGPVTPTERVDPVRSTSAGDGLKEKFRKFAALDQLPLIKILVQYLQSRFVQKKLNAIEQKIQHYALDNIHTVTKLLRELANTKLKYEQLFSVKTPIAQRLKDLKNSMIQKSHLAIKPAEETHSPLFSQLRFPQGAEAVAQQAMTAGNTHKKVLQALTEVATEQPVKSYSTAEVAAEKSVTPYPTPVRLHWRHESNEPAPKYIPVPKIKPGFIYVHASLNKLVSLLKNPSEDLVQSSINLRVSEHDNAVVAATNPSLVCGILLKYAPTFNPQPPSKDKLGFWQPQRNNHLPTIKFDASMRKHIDQLFFQSPDHYQNFKAMLINNHETELLELLLKLESQQQVKIQTPSTPTITP
jgi:hypothetical protein